MATEAEDPRACVVSGPATKVKRFSSSGLELAFETTKRYSAFGVVGRISQPMDCAVPKTRTLPTGMSTRAPGVARSEQSVSFPGASGSATHETTPTREAPRSSAIVLFKPTSEESAYRPRTNRCPRADYPALTARLHAGGRYQGMLPDI